MNAENAPVKPVVSATVGLCALALLKLALHLYFNRYYGYQRDELYFIACGEHLDWGYVDHTPLVPWLAFLSHALLGDSLSALRLLPALAGALTVLITGLMARELGAGRYGQWLAALSIIIAPVYLRAHNILHIPTFEPVFWGLCAYLIIRIIKYDTPRLWLWVGLIAGLGLMNKPTMLFFGVGLTIGLLLTPARKYLFSKWLWLGAGLALLAFLPNLIWQASHDWATLTFVRNLNKSTMSRIPVVEFLLGQLLYLHPFNAPIWLVGLYFYLRMPAGKPFRALGWIFVSVAGLLIVAKSKIYYLAPAYPMLLAAGATAVEAWLHTRPWSRLRPVVAGLLVLGGLAFAPVGLPVLSIDAADHYILTATGGVIQNAYELTSDFHDQFGWENQASTVARVYHSLTPEEQADCLILTGNYGEASAINFFGKQYGLPIALSTHMTYFLWGQNNLHGKLFIAYGLPQNTLDALCARVECVATIECKEAVPYEMDLPVFVCRDPKIPLARAWKQHGPSY